ncbi:MAG: hypothetical protein JNN15_14685, partial [Blastocatellia bacterium]|nr:hypothetical protein [Blastocatellia bacterium]
APKVTVINAVASGDAFLAGCAWALVSGLKTEEIIGWGVAAGSANATVGGAHIDKALVETFYQKLLY